MNYLNLDSPKEPEKPKEKKETSPTAIGFLACSFVSAAFALIAGAGNMPFLFVISTTAAITFTIVFYIDDSIPDREEPAPKPTLEEIMQVQPTAEELRARAEAIDRSNNIRSHSRSKTLGWTCSYCGTINVWKPGRDAVRCAHCGARYEGDELREL